MFRPFLSRSLVALPLLLSAACGGDVCEDAYNRQRDCVRSMDCTALPPTQQAACEQKRQLFSPKYSIYKAACRDPATGQPCACEGDWKTQWEIIAECDLRPETLCECR